MIDCRLVELSRAVVVDGLEVNSVTVRWPEKHKLFKQATRPDDVAAAMDTLSLYTGLPFAAVIQIAADEARLAVDRAEALRAELERRRAEAEEADRREAIERQYDEAKSALDAAAARIEADYPDLARRITDLASLAEAADNAAHEWNKLAMTNDHAASRGRLDSVAERVGWTALYDVNLDFAGALRLLPLGDFEGHGVDFPTKEWRYAVFGSSAPAVPAHQFN